jgi:hypothetical protein
MPSDEALAEAIAVATEAFDAGNHAWGRFLLYVLRPYHGPPPAPDPAPLRAALQEAAISVPQHPTTGEARAFIDALLIAYREAQTLTERLPATIRTGDILTVPDSFAEAIRALASWAEGES